MDRGTDPYGPQVPFREAQAPRHPWLITIGISTASLAVLFALLALLTVVGFPDNLSGESEIKRSLQVDSECAREAHFQDDRDAYGRCTRDLHDALERRDAARWFAWSAGLFVVSLFAFAETRSRSRVG